VTDSQFAIRLEIDPRLIGDDIKGVLRSAGFTGGYDLRIFPDIALANAA
jgi:hypothetical protein